MHDLQDEVLELLETVVGSTAHALDPLLERHSKESDFYSRFFLAVAHARLDEDHAKVHVSGMIDHHDQLTTSLGRPVDFRVTVLDYLVAHPDIVKMPGIVDLDAFRETERRATTDQLTGLYNRRFLQSYLDKELNRARRYDQQFSVVFLDVDDFKLINDTHGHTVGDRVLARVGREITSLLRLEDIAVRYGGEEFVIVLPQTHLVGAKVFAERLRARLAQDDESAIAVQFSAGIASYPFDGTTVSQLINTADAALYQAKLAGKDRVVVSRRGERYKADIPVLCFANDSELGSGTAFDISTNGIALYAHRLLKPGELLRLRVGAGTAGREYEVLTQVVWTQEVSDQHVYRLGAMWAGTDDETIDALIKTAKVS